MVLLPYIFYATKIGFNKLFGSNNIIISQSYPTHQQITRI